MADSVRGWLLDLGREQRAAVGEKELVEVVGSPSLSPVGEGVSPHHRTLGWRGRELPVLDLGSLVGGGETTEQHWAVVAAYLDEGGTVQCAALLLAAPPVQVRVDDQMECELPRSPYAAALLWRLLAISCFLYDGRAVPVMDLGRAFGADADNLLERFSAAWKR